MPTDHLLVQMVTSLRGYRSASHFIRECMTLNAEYMRQHPSYDLAQEAGTQALTFSLDQAALDDYDFLMSLYPKLSSRSALVRSIIRNAVLILVQLYRNTSDGRIDISDSSKKLKTRKANVKRKSA